MKRQSTNVRSIAQCRSRTRGQFEVHEHVFVTGPRSNGTFIRETQTTTSHFRHSHPGGDRPHQHPHTGPASYTIDQGEWRRATGQPGGGRKIFTAEPTGEQLPIVELEAWQKRFEVVVCEPTPRAWGTGPGIALPLRIALTFKIPFRVVDGRRRR